MLSNVKGLELDQEHLEAKQLASLLSISLREAASEVLLGLPLGHASYQILTEATYQKR